MTKPKTKNKKKLPALDKYVIFSLSCILVFTVTQIVVFIVTGTEQTALITCFFACFAGELLSLALIKRLKLKREYEIQGGKQTQLSTKPVEEIDNTGAFG